MTWYEQAIARGETLGRLHDELLARAQGMDENAKYASQNQRSLLCLGETEDYWRGKMAGYDLAAQLVRQYLVEFAPR